MHGRVCLTIAMLSVAGCEIPRDRPAPEGYHGSGWSSKLTGGKHAIWLRDNGYPIEDCQVCHGADGAESSVLPGCSDGGCHEQGVTFCGTCHGNENGPRPNDGAHEKHRSYCIECHAVPKSIRDPGHLDGMNDVAFSGLAKANQSSATWNAATNTCSDTYCHLGTNIEWKAPNATATPCNMCHGNPPDSHARFATVATPDSCANCHPDASSSSHVNGIVETNPLTCSTCHGQGQLGAPPAALDGSVDASSRGVGAHRRHLDETLADRIGRVVACTACHVVPQSSNPFEHIDTTSPADVSLVLGNYDAETGRCVTSCHFDTVPGPAWTDATGAARTCDACHGFPPAFTRKGTKHAPCQPTLAACLSCHSFTPESHVDGVVNVTP
ncbi:MAG: CxxxxCH/CxxCH domain-containing protein [Polyangiaceae bacterium]|nr:CxxxxCH/CxxCH domain-containing protein [Polyangiaceae bacterium]